LTRCWLPWAQ